MNQTSPAFKAALQITQQAVTLLAKWADAQFVEKFSNSPLEDAVEKAKEILSWPDNHDMKPLRLLFDSVNLGKGQDKKHYWLPKAIEDNHPTIPYPQLNASTDFTNLKHEIKTVCESLDQNDWGNLSLLTLIIEKFGSFISFGESDVALVDIARTTAAVASAIASNDNANELSLIAGDLSGIQKFIYTISSDGALKSLRARSFYLDLVTEEVVQQLLAELELPRTSIIYAGGGNLYLLASASEETEVIVKQVQKKFNKWLNNEFQSKVFLALAYLNFPANDVAKKEFTEPWNNIVNCLSNQKMRKFDDQIDHLLEQRESYSERCQVCHRDDIEDLEQLNTYENDSVRACPTCRNMFQLGDELFGVRAIVRSLQEYIEGAVHTIPFKFSEEPEHDNYYYHLFKGSKPIIKSSGTAFLLNNWEIKNYKFNYFQNQVTLMLLGNYDKESEEEQGGFIRAEEMAKKATGINRVGYLRMDVDRLGQIFARGLEEKTNFLLRLAGLSRQMSYFFKVYLNSLAENRYDNFIYHHKQGTVEVFKNAQYLTEKTRDKLLFIYAGGDDLFISGAWNEITELAFDIYQCFRAYTGYNPDITISGGISIDEIKFPLYQVAQSAEKAESAAKANGRDSLGLFSQVFKWDEWLGIKDISLVDSEIRKYLLPESKPSLLGIFPFVETLQKQNIGVNYSRNFVRNLLITAEIQEEALRKFKEDSKSQEALGTRYYLHLPKIAYTLARLPKNVLEDVDFRTSLKSPYNAPYFRAIATWIELLNRS
ncbi:Csm1 family CRISPR-associated protein [Cylindrospermum sp. NIES-4074]|nr:Csm1 family CRISPR-associated protein [Cylindrospermum sp. NIES-4074]